MKEHVTQFNSMAHCCVSEENGITHIYKHPGSLMVLDKTVQTLYGLGQILAPIWSLNSQF